LFIYLPTAHFCNDRENISVDIRLLGLPVVSDAHDMHDIREELRRLDEVESYACGEPMRSFLNLKWKSPPLVIDSWAYKANSCHFDVFIETLFWIFRHSDVEGSDGMGPFLQEVSYELFYQSILTIQI
jgi:hypothetical protein